MFNRVKGHNDRPIFVIFFSLCLFICRIFWEMSLELTLSDIFTNFLSKAIPALIIVFSTLNRVK